jgi:hypothetical protein
MQSFTCSLYYFFVQKFLSGLKTLQLSWIPNLLISLYCMFEINFCKLAVKHAIG